VGGRGRYAVRRLLIAGPTLLGLSLLIFLLGSLAGDPSYKLAERGLQPGETPTAEQIAAVRHELGLDRPLLVRYGEWLGQLAQGDLGRSLHTGEGVGDAIRGAVPSTVGLAAAATLLILVLSVPLGVVGALLRRRWWQQVVRLTALAGASVPGFFLAYLLIYLFAVRLHVLPVFGEVGPTSMVLPAVTLAVGPTALVSRLLQTALVEGLGEDYIRTARAKGLSESAIVVSHALRNAFLPVLTVVGSILARLLEGAVVVELIFGRSGIGNLTLQSVGSADYPMIQGVVLFAGVVVIAFNLLVDLTYPLLDPRVRLGAAA
jgi:ABC-type dipeptide/oligopeptide/nickel transport system permease component